MEVRTPDVVDIAALDRLADEIAELSAHLEAATARLSILFANSTLGAAGTTDSPRALPGSPGAWGSTWARPANGCEWRAPW